MNEKQYHDFCKAFNQSIDDAVKSNKISRFKARRARRWMRNTDAADMTRQRLSSDGTVAIDWDNVDWDELFGFLEKIIRLILELFG